MEAGRPAATQSPRPSCGDLSSAEPRRAFVVGQGPGGRPRQRNWTCKKEKKENPRSARVRGLTPRHVGESTSPQARAAGGGGKRYGARGGQVTRHARRVARAGGPVCVRRPRPRRRVRPGRPSAHGAALHRPVTERTNQRPPRRTVVGVAAPRTWTWPPSRVGDFTGAHGMNLGGGLRKVVFAMFVSLFD
jgi:hypothetical protein